MVAEGPGDADARDALSTLWEPRGLSLAMLVDASGTLTASDRRLTLTPASTAAFERGSLVREPLELGPRLGQGGMGVVQLASQRALRRDVAVKRVLDAGSSRATDALLKEAWIGGLLQHPNVVPVHALAEIDGAPAIVMKRIDGRTWRSWIRDPTTLPADRADDPLGAHLEVLLAVCRAVELAHARGILHLDLKPENVMVGSHGEVYVVDWGLAMGWGDAAPAWLPLVSTLRSVAGTPDYMAPELAAGASDRVDPRTDVYLLGAMLHEAVTGSPPHAGGSTAQRLLRAYRSATQEYTDAPAELVVLLHRAMAAEREARFPTVAAFREAVTRFRSHREALSLERAARDRLAALESRFARGPIDEAEVWERFGATRFAIREARAARVDGGDPLAALDDALHRRMAAWAIDVGRTELADAYVANLTEPPRELVDAIARRRDHDEARRAHGQALEQLAFHEDITLGAGFRRPLALVLGAIFLTTNLAMGTLERIGSVRLGYQEMLVTGVFSGLFLVVLGLTRYRAIFRNGANGALYTLCLGCFVALQCLWGIGLALDVPFRAALALTPIFYMLTLVSATLLVSARFMIAPLAQVATVVLAALFVDGPIYEVIGIGGGVSAAAVGIAFRDTEDAPDA